MQIILAQNQKIIKKNHVTDSMQISHIPFCHSYSSQSPIETILTSQNMKLIKTLFFFLQFSIHLYCIHMGKLYQDRLILKKADANRRMSRVTRLVEYLKAKNV